MQGSAVEQLASALQLSAEDLLALFDAIMRDRWAGARFTRGGLPTFPNVDALPTASAFYRGKVAAVLGGTGAADVVYCCLKDAAEAYAWEVVATA